MNRQIGYIAIAIEKGLLGAETMPKRILHVVGGMDRGGAETWLMHLLRNIDRDRFQMDFLVHTEKKCAFDGEIESLGSKVIHCPHHKNPFRYKRQLGKILEQGRYDIVHSHVHHYSGFVLLIADQKGVPLRIAHSHNDTTYLEKKAHWTRRIYLRLMDHLIKRHANVGIAVSDKAGESLFGAKWQQDGRWKLLYCGIDLEPFRQQASKSEIRYGLGIPEDAFLMGHVGRFHEQKNHDFLIDIAAEVMRLDGKAYLLLVGGGPLQQAIKNKVTSKGISDRVVFAGIRDDAPELLKSIDVFVMPSLFEGLPIVLMEAQAAGIRCFISDRISKESKIIKTLTRTISLNEPASKWANEILTARIKEEDAERSLRIMNDSPFNISNSMKSLISIYENCGK